MVFSSSLLSRVDFKVFLCLHVFGNVLFHEALPPVRSLFSSSMVCPWPFMAAFDSTMDKPLVTMVKPQVSGKSFAQALSGEVSGETFLPLLTSKVVMGNSVCVKISQAAYKSGIAACSFNLHGRLTLQKGDSPLTTLALKSKLNNLWPQLNNWTLIPLGKGFFELNFSSIEDMKKIWAFGVINLKPGFMRFYR